jgi:hypothetical protein
MQLDSCRVSVLIDLYSPLLPLYFLLLLLPLPFLLLLRRLPPTKEDAFHGCIGIVHLSRVPPTTYFMMPGV